MESLCVKDRSYVLSPTSTTSSSGEVEMTSAFEIQRSKLNAFLAECGIHPLKKPWLEWANVGERTHPRYIQRALEIISSVLKVVYPGNSSCLWSQYQASTAISEMLGDEAVCSPSDRSYLEGLAEAYKNATAWDTRRQILSVMAGIASYQAISLCISGIAPCRYTMDIVSNLVAQPLS